MTNSELIILAKSGDKSAKDRLVEDNLGLVWNIVKKFYNRGYDADDLFQIGSLGLVKSIEKFDLSFDVQFSTYAVPLILGEIKKFLRDDGIIKISRSVKELYTRVLRTREELTKKLDREPTIKEIAAILGVEAEEIAIALEALSGVESLNAERGDADDGKNTLADTVADSKILEDEVVNKIALKQALAKMDEKERQVIILRYFHDLTQNQVGKMLGLSQVQVSRIESRVMQKMRAEMS